MGHSVLAKSKTPKRIDANLEGDFKLSSEEVARIAQLDRKLRFNDGSADMGMNLFADLEGKGSHSAES